MAGRKKNLYDVVVIGGGPAGLTAALYLARARYRVLVVEKEHFGGQITITSEVVNYPGLLRVSGTELTDVMRRQAEAFGAEFLLAEVESIDPAGDIRRIKTNRGEFSCFGILLATGARPRMAGFQGEEEFRGRGVAYCATCDGEFFTGKEVFVIGGGFAAAEESVFLTKYASHVTILIRGEDFRCAETAADVARDHEKITVLTSTEVLEAVGDTALRTLRYRNKKTGKITEYRAPDGDTFGVFVFAGYEPATELVKDFADLDEEGYVVTDQTLQTSMPGVYAAGDVCVKKLRQVATAVGDGALAAAELERYASMMQARTGQKPEPREEVRSTEKTERSEMAEREGAAQRQEGIFTPEMRSQLQTVFSRMEQPLVLKVMTDDSSVSAELLRYMEELAALTEKLSVVAEASGAPDGDLPCVRICKADGTWSGLAFHGVPGGHEFTSFVLGLYNAAGPGQALDEETQAGIDRISRPVRMRILVSLSCTMCPELVTAAWRIAAENPLVTAEAYDLNHFPALKEEYSVMSVPCLLIDGKPPVFGKKNIRQLLELLG